MSNAMKKHVEDYKADMIISVRNVFDIKLRKKKQEQCKRLWELSAKHNWGKTLAEIEKIVKEDGNGST